MGVLSLALTGCGGDERARGAGGAGGSAGAAAEVSFERFVLSNEFLAEGASFGDFDGDGENDVVAGPYVYLGPDFGKSVETYAPKSFDPKGYSDNFFAFPRDLDADGWLDVLFVGFPGQAAYWHRNPGASGGAWDRHVALPAVDTEAPVYLDLTGDGTPELVCATGGKLGWAEPNASDPTSVWSFRPATGPEGFVPFTHGLGVGDVDGDGRADLMEHRGVWRQPASLGGDPVWPFASHEFGSGGAQMYATDVDGDGDSDVVTSLAAHGHGLAWFEQTDTGGFVAHEIASPDPKLPGAGVVLHEPHALALADVNGDGLPDIVAGERFWGHADGWSGDLAEPASLYWFELQRTSSGAHYLPHLIDAASGVGTQVVSGDVDGDGRVDVVVANKKGAFVFLQAPSG